MKNQQKNFDEKLCTYNMIDNKQSLKMVSLFKNIAYSREVLANASVETVLNAILNGELQYVLEDKKTGVIIHKTFNTKKQVTQARKAGKKSVADISVTKKDGTVELINRYNQIKKHALCVTFAADFKEKRTLKSERTLSNRMYFDVDGIKDLSKIEDIKRAIATIEGVEAVWLSFSGEGLGGVVKMFNVPVNADSYINVFHYLNGEIARVMRENKLEMVQLDKACKDISRLTVISYDEKMIYNKEAGIDFNKIPQIEQIVYSAGQKNYKRVTLSSIENESVCNSALNSAMSRMEGDKFGTNATVAYASICNKKGVRKEYAFEHLRTAVFSALSNEKIAERRNTLYDIYERYNKEFATEATVHAPFVPNSELLACYTLLPNERLSDLNLKIDRNCLLIAPTGTGKTYTITKMFEKVVFCVPTKTLCNQVAQYGFAQYYEEMKNIGDKIVVTYSSLESLTNKIKTKDYVLVVDEAHNLTASAERSYMNSEMWSIVNALDTFKMHVLLTATPLRSEHHKIATLPYIHVAKQKDTVKTLERIEAENVLKGALELCKDAKKANKIAFVYYNNISEKLATLTALLRNHNLKVMEVNSTTKNQESYNDLIVEQDAKDYDVIVSTSVLKEGVSITKHPEQVEIIVLGSFHPVEVEQIAERFRNAKQINCTIVKGKSKDEEKQDFPKISGTIYRNSQLSANSLNTQVRLTNMLEMTADNTLLKKHVLFENQLQCNVALRIVEDDFFGVKVVYDELQASYMEFAKQREWYNKAYNFEFFAKFMSEFGWKKKDVGCQIETKYTKEDKTTVNNTLAQLEMAEINLEESVIADIEATTLEENAEMVRKNITKAEIASKINKERVNIVKKQKETDVRKRVVRIENYIAGIETTTDAIEYMRKNGLTNEKNYTRFNLQIAAQCILFFAAKKGVNSNYAAFIEALYKTFAVGVRMTKRDVVTTFTEIYKQHFNTQPTFTTTRITQFLGKLLKIKRAKVSGDSEGIEVLDNNEFGISEMPVLCMKFAVGEQQKENLAAILTALG